LNGSTSLSLRSVKAVKVGLTLAADDMSIDIELSEPEEVGE
jgi:hypothetical protein